MDVIVNDTNIFIDLHSIGLLDEMSLLPFEIHTVDFVLAEISNLSQRECVDKLIEENKIHVHSFTSEEVMAIVMAHSQAPGNLSLTDVAVCHYALGGSYKVITGDRQMRNFAESKSIEVHGIIYLFDEMIRNKILSPSCGAAKLMELRAINVRLPKSEIESRIEKWS